jgi:hypothetical protein
VRHPAHEAVRTEQGGGGADLFSFFDSRTAAICSSCDANLPVSLTEKEKEVVLID